MATKKTPSAAQPSSTPATAPALVEVTLAKPHTHDGVDYAAGTKIQVSSLDRDWLEANEIIETSTATKETP